MARPAGAVAERGITADIELIPIQQINEAYERMLRSDVASTFYFIDAISMTKRYFP
jgi:uncharacterized zinc-type alcohol dehydrogenase-like protein